jgi:O-antigen/teichoic acid export membrane protein
MKRIALVSAQMAAQFMIGLGVSETLPILRGVRREPPAAEAILMIEAAPVEDRPSLASRLSKGFAWNLLATVSSQGSTFAGNIIVARLLGAVTFGEYAMVQATVVPLGMAAQLATGYAAAKYVAEYRSSDPERAGRIVGLCGIACLLTSVAAGGGLVGLSSWLAAGALEAPQLAPWLAIGGLFVVCTALTGYQAGVLTGLENYAALAQASAASALITVAGITVGAAWQGLGGAVLALSATALLRALAHQVCLWRALRQAGIRAHYRGMLQEVHVLGRFALPAALAGSYTYAAIWLANLILVRQPDGYEQLALTTAGMNIRMLAIFAPLVCNTVIASVLNQLKGSGQSARYDKLFRMNLAATTVVGLVVALMLASGGPLVLGVFGKAFGANASLLWPFLLAGACETTTAALFQSVQTHGKMWQSFLGIHVPRDLLYVVATYYTTPLDGAWGLAWSYFAACCYSLASTVVLVCWISRSQRNALCTPSGSFLAKPGSMERDGSEVASA